MGCRISLSPVLSISPVNAIASARGADLIIDGGVTRFKAVTAVTMMKALLARQH